MSRSYVASVAQISAIVHKLSPKRVAEQLNEERPKTIYEVADVLAECGWDGVRLADEDDFDEAMRELDVPVRNGMFEFPDDFEKRAGRFMHLRVVRDIYANE